MTNARLLVFLIASTATSTSLGVTGYKCNVISAQTLTSDGTMGVTEWVRQYIGKDFVVDRTTGRMIGEIFNHNANGEPQVLDSGSKAQAFKVMTIFKPMTQVKYLSIREFDDREQKPFIYLDVPDTVISGICTQY